MGDRWYSQHKMVTHTFAVAQLEVTLEMWRPCERSHNPFIVTSQEKTLKSGGNIVMPEHPVRDKRDVAEEDCICTM